MLFRSDGATWTNPFCCEGFFLERLHRVANVADGKITFVSCGACGDFVSNPGFTGIAGWPDVTAPPTANPKIVRQSWFVQGVATSGSFTKGFATTSNFGTSWSQYANVPEDFRDIAKLSDPGLLPVLYQSIRTGWDATNNFEINHLARVTKRLFAPGATTTYPLMNNFGGLGINPTMFAWYQVFGVDPANTRHLIAPDIVNQKMMETTDGGDNWTEIPGLTSQITDGGTFLFRRYMFPQASAVSFSPDDPRYVAIGTWQNGLFLSADRGATWTKVPGSELATYITSIEWKNASDAVVSTYGRGLWRVQWRVVLPPFIFETYCRVPCLIDPWDIASDPAEQVIDEMLVFNGRVQGARMANGVLRELFVSPGSSVVFFADTKEARDIKVTESAKTVGFGDNVKVPRPPANRMLTGFAFNRAGKVIRGIYTEKPLSMYEPTQLEREQDKDPKGRQESEVAGKPYISLQLGSGAANTVVARKPFTIALRNFAANASIEIAIDGYAVEKRRVNEKGEAIIRVVAPREPGLHSVTVRDAQTQRVIDGAMFIVRHEDARRERRVNVPARP